MRLTLLLAILALFCEPTLAQSRPSTVVLRELTQRSAFIFGGTVSSVDWYPSTGVPTVRITLKVDHAVRGVRRGQMFTMREWAGLWNSGPRYRKGKRVFLFLYPPSSLGLTSPVAGPLGRLEVDDNDNVIMPPGRGAALADQHTSALRRKSRMTARDFARAVRRAGKD